MFWIFSNSRDFEFEQLSAFAAEELAAGQNPTGLCPPVHVAFGMEGVDGAVSSNRGIQGCWAVDQDPQPSSMGAHAILILPLLQQRDASGVDYSWCPGQENPGYFNWDVGQEAVWSTAQSGKRHPTNTDPNQLVVWGLVSLPRRGEICDECRFSGTSTTGYWRSVEASLLPTDYGPWLVGERSSVWGCMLGDPGSGVTLDSKPCHPRIDSETKINVTGLKMPGIAEDFSKQ